MRKIRELVSASIGFEWDKGNFEKNLHAHKVSNTEIEQAIRNRPIAFAEDFIHSGKESRYSALGRTNLNRLLSIVFTIRENRIRAISARDMDLEEKRIYYEEGY